MPFLPPNQQRQSAEGSFLLQHMKNLCVQLYPFRRQQLLKNEPKIKAENNKDALLNTNVKMASCSRI